MNGNNELVPQVEYDGDLEEQAPPMMRRPEVVTGRVNVIRGGAETDDNTEVNSAPGDSEGENDNISEALVSKKAPDDAYAKESMDTKDREKRERRRRMLMACCCLVLLLVLLIGLGLGLSGDDSSTSLVIADSPTIRTSRPTSSPEVGVTNFPTVAPTTGSPTSELTGPTASPTIDLGVDLPSVSRLACAEIIEEPEVSAGNKAGSNFEVETIAGRDICGDVYAGPDPERPNRNYWHAQLGRRDCPEFTLADANAKCESVGARLCGANEVANLVAQGKGCGSDNFFVWTQSACETDDGDDGYYQINVEFRLERGNDPFFNCVTDIDQTTVLKCCGDYDLEEATAAHNEFFGIESRVL